MSQVASPYGLRVKKMLGDTPFSGGSHTYSLTQNTTAGIYYGDPVGLVAGQPTPIIATPTTTIGPNNPIGVMMGASWIDPIRGFVNSQYLPANLYSSGATKIQLKIADSPSIVMQVQADGPVVLSQIGLNASLNVPSPTGSTVTGNSLISLNTASILGTATLAVRIYDIPLEAAPSPGASNQPGDPFTDVLVLWNFGIHRFQMGAGQ